MGRNVELSKRMQAVADMVTPGNRVCDVGCDHGYVSIYLVQTVYLGDQNGIGNEVNQKGVHILNGWWKMEEDRQIFLWTQAMKEAFGNMEGVYLIPAALTFDSAYNYREAEMPVNARSSKTETVLVEAMHPDEDGYLQIADTLFNTYCGTMK